MWLSLIGPFLKNLMDSRIEKLEQSAKTEKETKDAENINVSETFLAILKSSYEVQDIYESFYKENNTKMPKKILSIIEVKINDLFQNVTTSTGFDDIIVLAIAYHCLGAANCYNYKFNVAVNHFTRCIELLSGKELDYKAILIAVQVHVDLGIVWQKLNMLEKCYPLLYKAVELYLNYTKEEDEYPYPIEIPTFFQIYNFSNTKIKLTKFYALTLDILAEFYQLYPIDKHKFVIYVHNLLNKELIESLNSKKELSMDWSVAAAELSTYFIHNNRFIEARNHLDAADYILDMSFKSTIKTVEVDLLTSVKDNHDQFCANVAILWGVYGVSLLRLSVAKSLCEDNKYCEMYKIKSKFLAKSGEETKPLIFADLKGALEHIKIPNTPVSNRKDAKIILENCLEKFIIGKRYYTVDRNIMTHVKIILYICSTYKHYAYFVEEEKKMKIIKQRIKILKDAINNIFLRCNTLQQYEYCKLLYLELATTYCTLLNMTSEKLNEIEEVTDEMRMEIKQLVENILDNFTLFLKNT